MSVASYAAATSWPCRKNALAGEDPAWSCPRDFRAFFALGTARCAGVGLLISRAFLERFLPTSAIWEILVPGRAAVLRLDGPTGCADIYSLSFATGDAPHIPADPAAGAAAEARARQQRADMRLALAGAMRPAHLALSILLGDFNWVPENTDRWHKRGGSYTGHRDARDEAHFVAHIARPFALRELRQPAATHDNAHARSRLDRVYRNQPLSEQLDRQIVCSALEWIPHLSAHRAVAFSRSRPPPFP